MRQTRLMSEHVLIRCYKRMKARPLRTFILHDFGLNCQRDRVYLTTLVHLGLVEEVSVIYKAGRRHVACRATHGYRFLRRDKK